MSVHFISGKPGGDKSLYALKLIVEELLYGHRRVVTNLPIRPGVLNGYLQKEYPDRTIDLLSRLYILDDSATEEFWTFRGMDSKGPELLSKERWVAGEKPDYGGVKDDGVFYVIDEVHNFFNARAWMETGRDVLFYLSQHRKLGDTVVAVTQSIGNVDKQFRSVTQDYTYLRNMSKEKLGPFKLPAMFLRQTYLQPATDTTPCMESGTFRLDVSGLAACYDTASGVGIHARAGDIRERRKGMHWSVGVGAVVLLVCLVGFGLPRAVGAMFKTDTVKNLGKASSAQAPGLTNVWDGIRPGAFVKPQGVVYAPPPEKPATNEIRTLKETGLVSHGVKMAGFLKMSIPGQGPRFEWLLSNGRRVKPGDKDFVSGGPEFIELKGVGRLDYFASTPGE